MDSTFLYFIIFVIIFLPLIIMIYRKPKYINYIGSDKIPDEFETIYKNLYDSHISTLENMRENIRWRTALGFILLGVCAVGLIFSGSAYTIIAKHFPLIMKILSFACFFAGVYMLFTANKYLRRYLQFYKNEIINNFIKLINNKLIYKPTPPEYAHPQFDYVSANFDNTDFNQFIMDDWIEGYLTENAFVNICDIRVSKITETEDSKEKLELFQGLFAVTKCDRNIKSFLRIARNRTEMPNKKIKIEMDSGEFEKYFDVYCDDKLITMRILTSDIMEYLTNFCSKYKLSFEITFKNNNIYLRFFTGHMFEPKVFGSSMDKQLLFLYYSILKFIIEITTKVNVTLQEIEV